MDTEGLILASNRGQWLTEMEWMNELIWTELNWTDLNELMYN